MFNFGRSRESELLTFGRSRKSEMLNFGWSWELELLRFGRSRSRGAYTWSESLNFGRSQSGIGEKKKKKTDSHSLRYMWCGVVWCMV